MQQGYIIKTYNIDEEIEILNWLKCNGYKNDFIILETFIEKLKKQKLCYIKNKISYIKIEKPCNFHYVYIYSVPYYINENFLFTTAKKFLRLKKLEKCI